jgi:hypothetical protein
MLARMAVPKFVAEVACAAGLACQTYLDHILDRRGRLYAHRQLNRSVKRTLKEPRVERVKFRNTHAR